MPASAVRTLLLVLAVGLLPARAMAQRSTVIGRVTVDGSGQPLAGATVQVVGTDRRTATDALGRFVLREFAGDAMTLSVSAIGYAPARRIVQFAGGTTVRVELALTRLPTQLDQVLVRGEKFARDLQRTQTSVGVVTGEEARALPFRDWEDAALLVGNVSTSGSGAFSIRGISNAGVDNSGGNPTAALYIDGVQQGTFTTARTIRGMWDVEAVEVLRGPQSTTSGRNALAGAVYLRSAAPEFAYRSAARVRGGGQSALEGAAMVTGPLIPDQLAFRLSAEAGRQDAGIALPLLDATTPGFARTNTLAQRNVRARVLATPSALPGLSALLSYTYGFDRPIAFLGVTGPDVAARRNVAPLAYVDETTLHNTALEIGYQLQPGVRFTSVTGAVSSNYTLDGLTHQSRDTARTVPLAHRSRTDGLNVTQELRLNMETSRTQAVVGAFVGRFGFERDRVDRGDVYPVVRPQLGALLGRVLPPNAPIPVFEVNYQATTRNVDRNTNVALFGEVNRELIDDRLTLTLGLRYDRERFGGTTRISDPQATIVGSPLPAAVNAQVASALLATVNVDEQRLDAEFEALLPKLGLTVELTRDASIGATVQRGYRAGGSAPGVISAVNVFGPEYTWNYELAFRSRWFGGRMTANANVFYADWRDQQVRVPIPGTTQRETRNAGASTLHGGEVELRLVPARGVTAFSSVGVTTSRFDRFVLDGRNLAGFAFPGAPATTGAAGLIVDRGRGIVGALNVSYVGANYSEVGTITGPDGALRNDPALRAGDYTIVDAQLGYALRLRGAQARVTVFARNLLDTVARDLTQYDELRQPTAILRPPRVVGLGVEMGF
ncbi:MAG: TonB-dependent receptor [Gemmatimonadaceae bacterium]|nr:TonB-dependent receptor [Gemmatimonadaceae bacterium]